MGSKYDRDLAAVSEVRRKLGKGTPVILAGRELTFAREAVAPSLESNELLVLGDPESVVSRLLETASLSARLEAQSGSVVLGEPWDPAEYCSPPRNLCVERDTAYVLWATGCACQCGYCPYGYNWAHLYGPDHFRRARPMASVVDDVLCHVQHGIRHVRLVADHAFGTDPDQNGPFLDLCRCLARNDTGITLGLGLTTQDVALNVNLLTEASRLVRLHLNLAVDFASFDQLTQFRLESTPASHREALSICRELGIPFTIGYIFLSPLLTVGAARDLFALLRDSATCFLHNGVPFAHILVHDILLTALITDSCTPADPVLRAQLLSARPEPQAINFCRCLVMAFRDAELLSSLLLLPNSEANLRMTIDRFEHLLDICPSDIAPDEILASLLASALRVG